MTEQYCESCLESGKEVPATRHSINPEYAGYLLCDICAAEYDSRVREQGREGYPSPDDVARRALLTCGGCGSRKPAEQSCGCFDNSCQ